MTRTTWTIFGWAFIASILGTWFLASLYFEACFIQCNTKIHGVHQGNNANAAAIGLVLATLCGMYARPRWRLISIGLCLNLMIGLLIVEQTRYQNWQQTRQQNRIGAIELRDQLLAVPQSNTYTKAEAEPLPPPKETNALSPESRTVTALFERTLTEADAIAIEDQLLNSGATFISSDCNPANPSILYAQSIYLVRISLTPIGYSIKVTYPFDTARPTPQWTQNECGHDMKMLLEIGSS